MTRGDTLAACAPDHAAPPPLGPRRVAFNRAVLENAARAWERRPPRRVRREQQRAAA